MSVELDEPTAESSDSDEINDFDDLDEVADETSVSLFERSEEHTSELQSH